jgi:hypothetical protein
MNAPFAPNAFAVATAAARRGAAGVAARRRANATTACATAVRAMTDRAATRAGAAR